jgi:hypothetical protein
MKIEPTPFGLILNSALFRLNGPAIDIPQACLALVSAIEAEDPESDAWLSWGECHETSAPDFIVGAYWALSEWHGGQSSPEYAALCALGRIYRPGYESTPTEDDPAFAAYDAVCSAFQSRRSA